MKFNNFIAHNFFLGTEINDHDENPDFYKRYRQRFEWNIQNGSFYYKINVLGENNGKITYKGYHLNGTLSDEYCFIYGLQHGRDISYDINGKIKNMCYVFKGNMCGCRIQFLDNDKIRIRSILKGKIISQYEI